MPVQVWQVAKQVLALQLWLPTVRAYICMYIHCTCPRTFVCKDLRIYSRKIKYAITYYNSSSLIYLNTM